MDARTVRLVERSVERTAAALFGGASGYAANAFAGAHLPRPIALTAAFATLLLTGTACLRLLGRIAIEEPRYDLADFDVHDIEPELTEDASPGDEPLAAEDALELDDVLPEPAPDSRVVRLFAPEAMPQVEPDGRVVPDAAKDLYEALAHLRRSLR